MPSQVALLCTIGDQQLALSLAVDVRMGWTVERTPLVAEAVEPDCVPDDAHSPIAPDHEMTDRQYPDARAALPGPYLRIITRGSVAERSYAAEPGTTTLFGCSLCTSLRPTASENEAWLHVVRAHGQACTPGDRAIWAARFPLLLADE